MRLHCPTCDALVSAATLNMMKDIGVCPGCQHVFTISEVVMAGRADMASLLERPPRGASLARTARGFVATATTRHAVAMFLVPFMVVWSMLTIGAVYGGQIAQHHFNLGFSLFGLPFVIGGLFFWWLTLTFAAGTVRVTMRDGAAEVFTGVGPFGRRQRFRWDAVTAVRAEQPSQASIVLEGVNVRFGANVSSQRKEFLMNALRSVLARRSVPVYR